MKARNQTPQDRRPVWGLVAGAFPGLISNGVTSAPLDVWPMNVFPSFIAPASMSDASFGCPGSAR